LEKSAVEGGVFNLVAQYYDLLYKDKNYEKEISFLREIISDFDPNAKSILDLGCGTGVHDWLLADRGYKVEGIDMSEQMLQVARERAVYFPSVTYRPTFRQGTLENFRTEERFDLVVSLFDVVSYLRDFDALRAFARNVKASLKPDGLLIFDCWYGPAVHYQRPGTRIRRLENDAIKLVRISEGHFDPNRNRIDVEYEIFLTRKLEGTIHTFRESHALRCYFEDELDEILGQCGFKRFFAQQWFDRSAPSVQSWSVLFGYQVR